MRVVGMSLGAVCIAAGITQWLWTAWAFEASWHLGSPIRLHGAPKDPAMHNLYSTGLQLIHVLDPTLMLLIVNGVLFIATGVVLVLLSRRHNR